MQNAQVYLKGKTPLSAQALKSEKGGLPRDTRNDD